ncbi:hypothetical protein [Novipirellula sp.]|uniref:hypothetical protein n=1 Tax=Novipirellula sp. TaxID=2795430 RepID=UPI003567A754
MVFNEIGARKKPLVKSQAASRVEDNGLEQTPKTPCFGDVEGEAAQNPAQFDEETSELLRIWHSLDIAAKADLLNVARGLKRRKQSTEHAT